MTDEPRPRTLDAHRLEAFYDEEYYRSHGHVTDDQEYVSLLAHFWREAIFVDSGLESSLSVLDWGSGVGSKSLALPNCVCYDPSDFARSYLRGLGRAVVDHPQDLAARKFDIILLSHVLEHSLTPADDLCLLHTWIKDTGLLVVILPSSHRRSSRFFSQTPTDISTAGPFRQSPTSCGPAAGARRAKGTCMAPSC